ncbi:MAG: hypothetical protein NVSMB46_04620 [Candidatus Saccharimonadales bacterium]
MDHSPNGIMQIPVSVVSPVDVGRLVREVDVLDNFLVQAAIRSPGSSAKLPRTTRLMDEIIHNNNLNVLHNDERQRLSEFLKSIKSEAPVLHISFSADPSPFFIQKLMTWLRQEIHPLVLLQVGLQPNIGAGCVMRTSNRYFDFSIRQKLNDSRPILLQKIKGKAV